MKYKAMQILSNRLYEVPQILQAYEIFKWKRMQIISKFQM